MDQKFPLYENLVQRVDAREEKNIDIYRVCTTITNLSQNLSPEDARFHYEIIAALILHHEIIHNRGMLLSTVPYDGKVMVAGKGILYNMTNLPPRLQQIIAQYIDECSND